MVDLAKISVGGKVASVNEDYAGNFQGLLNDLHSEGYNIKSIGGYNYRNIAGTNRLSKHAFGNALDINPADNPVAFTAKDAMKTNLPPNASSLAEKWGLKWGGDFKGLKKDPMHFEVTSNTKPIGMDASKDTFANENSATSDSPEFLGYKGGDNSDLYQGDNASPDKGAPLSMASPSTDPRWGAADANGDGNVTVTELKAYNEAQSASKSATSGDAGNEGLASNIPKAIVSAADQQSKAAVSAAETLAKTAADNTEATNASNTGIWQGLQTWLGGRLLQIMVFVLAAIFVLVGLYMFAPRNVLPVPSLSGV